MREYAGVAAIGHVRYATCGRDDRSYAQPFERHHIKKHKWFSFAFNGQLANYLELREELLDNDDNYLARETDTEIIMHQMSSALSSDRPVTPLNLFRHLGPQVRRGLQHRLSRRLGQHDRRPRSAGHQAAVLRAWTARCSPPPARAWRC